MNYPFKQILKVALLCASSFFTSLLGAQQVELNKPTSAEQRAENEAQMQLAIIKASKAWKDAFNAGDAKAAAALYEENAVMVAKPFGTFRGKAEILAFWTDLIEKGFDDVVYINSSLTILDDKSARIAANWKMNNAQGVITNEHWVIQSDGRALMREDHFEVVP